MGNRDMSPSEAVATTDPAAASLVSVTRRIEERSRASGQTLDQAAAVVVEGLERAAAALTARTAPHVPSSGVLVPPGYC